MSNQEAYSRFYNDTKSGAGASEHRRLNGNPTEQPEGNNSQNRNEKAPFELKSLMGSWGEFERYVIGASMARLGIQTFTEYNHLKLAYPKLIAAIAEKFSSLQGRHQQMTDDQISRTVRPAIDAFLDKVLADRQTHRNSVELPTAIDEQVALLVEMVIGTLQKEGRYNAGRQKLLQEKLGGHIRKMLLTHDGNAPLTDAQLGGAQKKAESFMSEMMEEGRKIMGSSTDGSWMRR